MGAPSALALDIGGTKLAAGVVDTHGRVHSFVRRQTEVERGVDDVVRRLIELGHRAIERSGYAVAQLSTMGIGCGGPLDVRRGTIHNPPNLPGWDDLPIVDICSRAFGLPAHLENDGVAAAIAEYTHGAGQGHPTLVYLTVSTGIGGGVLINGRPLRGRNGNGGELGHMVIIDRGRPCRCGGHGCLEAYASGTSIGAQAAELIRAGDCSELTASAYPTAADVAAAARRGDPLAHELWGRATRLLGTGVANLVNVFEPDAVVLGGGVTRAGAQLLDPVRRRVAEATLNHGEPTPVLLSQLGDTVGVVGAATAALAAYGSATSPTRKDVNV